MSKILKSTTRGQITIPIEWRKEFNTDKFLAKKIGGKIVIEPLLVENTRKDSKEKSLASIIRDENKNGKYESVFNVDRDNNGKGIAVEDVLKILRDLDE